jgi:hypothetical protein
MPRLRYGDRGRNNLTLGVGLSGGEFADTFLVCDDCTTYPVQYMLWANFEIGVERWWPSGFALRSFVGYAQGLLTASPYSTIDFPYVGSGMGYAF